MAVRASVRRQSALAGSAKLYVTGNVSKDTDWRDALRGVDAVVHAAARVHVLRESAADPLAAFRSVNVEGTKALARQAAIAGVRRFVFISSVKVNGERTHAGQPFTATDPPRPEDPYGISKLEAENALRQISSETGMEVVIVRPVLVYGPGVKANFRAMMKWVHRGVPLPLGSVRNQRSFVAMDNLTDLVAVCIRHPGAAGRTFLVSDGEDMSTPELLQRIAMALGVRPRVFNLPSALLRGAATLVGKKAYADRLCASLQVDISATREILGWTPPHTVDAALRSTALDFLETQETRGGGD